MVHISYLLRSRKGRAARIRKVLEFIRDKDKIKVSEVLKEFCLMGVKSKTLEDYIKTLQTAKFIEYDAGGSWSITPAGEKFLEDPKN